MIIDSHQHFWRYDPATFAWITDDMKVLRRDFLPHELSDLLNENAIDGCVVVQVDQSEKETEYLLSLADQHAFIKGVVGWIDLRANDLDERLTHYSQFKKLKGFRHIVQSEPSGFLLTPAFIRGVKMLSRFNFTYDLLIYHHQLSEAVLFLREVNDVKIVIDHLAKPAIKMREIGRWKSELAAVASLQNVYCKISGMVTEANWSDWKAQEFTPYLDELLKMFGTTRLMYGSDWPVCLVAATYHEQFTIVQKYISGFTNKEKRQIMGENAKRFYNL